MRRSIAFLSMSLLLALAGQASAQQFSTTMGSAMSGSNPQGNTTAFMSSTMQGSRPMMSSPLNFQISSLFPSFSGLQNTLQLKNMFAGPQATVQNPNQTAGYPSRYQRRKLNGNGTGNGNGQ